MIALLIERGIRDRHVLAAMAEVPREAFVPPALQSAAYDDSALPIDYGQTISQPFVVALMLEAAALGRADRVLDVGTGSGYAAAVMSRIVRHVYTIERVAALAARAETRLASLGYVNVTVATGDGTLGWPEHAPFDAIVVAAGGRPEAPPALVEQLATGGRLVIPLGYEADTQELVRLTREPRGYLRRESLGDVRFVPLVGAGGWTATD
jgi:protein-L-isoaspartate(D-aspartate) O-methyltransferase